MKLPFPTALKLAITLLATTVTGTPAVLAQTIYRHVDRNGQVVFSDQPPAANAPTIASPGPSVIEASTASMPYEVRQVMQRYPVTIYTRDACEPCDAGRALLEARGIPFDERQVRTAADGDALRRLSGQDALPLLAIGTQQLKGFADTDRQRNAVGVQQRQMPRSPARQRAAGKVLPRCRLPGSLAGPAWRGRVRWGKDCALGRAPLLRGLVHRRRIAPPAHMRWLHADNDPGEIPDGMARDCLIVDKLGADRRGEDFLGQIALKVGLHVRIPHCRETGDRYHGLVRVPFEEHADFRIAADAVGLGRIG